MWAVYLSDTNLYGDICATFALFKDQLLQPYHYQ